jgi:alcohol dehydrogenase
VSGPVPTVRPEVTVAGFGAIDQLPSLLRSTGMRRVLLVCGQTSFEASGAARILPALERAFAVRRWDEHRPNPTADHIAAGLRVTAEHRPDVIVGVGGGSTLDSAKVVAALSALEDGSDVERVARRIEGQQVTANRDVGLVLAPTTSGSGAQVTHFATVYLGETKHSVVGAALLPDRIVLDPELAMSGTSHQRAVSGIDALAQAIESMWAVGGDERSRDDAEAAIQLLSPALVSFAREPDAKTAQAMATGSQLAGAAINRSRTTVPHALSYALTQQAGLAHGHAVAHTLPAVLARHLTAEPTALAGVTFEEHRRNMARLRDALGVADSDGATALIETIISKLGLRDPERSAHALIATQVDELARSIDEVRARNNPVRLTHADLRSVLLAGTA